MSQRLTTLLLFKNGGRGRMTQRWATRPMSSAAPSYTRVGESMEFPRNRPGLDYAFNWSLNRDGVTPLKKSAFRLMKGLDLKIAGIDDGLSKTSAKVKAAASSTIVEAGTDALSFDKFDTALATAKDQLSSSDHLYVPEGHAPGTHIGVRVISNSPHLAANLVSSYLDRMPKRDPVSQRITVYALESSDLTSFSGYAIEEEEDTSETVSAVVLIHNKIDATTVATAVEASVAAFEADAAAEAGSAE